MQFNEVTDRQTSFSMISAQLFMG